MVKSNMVEVIQLEEGMHFLCMACNMQLGDDWSVAQQHECFATSAQLELHSGGSINIFSSIPGEVEVQGTEEVLVESRVDVETGAEEPERVAAPSKSWTHKETVTLIRSYENRLNTSTKKKRIWSAVAQELRGLGIEVKAAQCYKRWSRLLTAYKMAIEKMETTSKYPVKFQYFDLVHSCLEGRPKAKFPYVEESILPTQGKMGTSSTLWPSPLEYVEQNISNKPRGTNVNVCKVTSQEKDILAFMQQYITLKEMRERIQEEARRRREDEKEKRKDERYKEKMALKEKKLEVLAKLVAERSPKFEERKRRREEMYKEEMEMKAKKLNVLAELIRQ